MRPIPVRVWGLAVFAGLLQVLPFPIADPVPYWRTAFGWVALVPLLVALLDVRPGEDRLSVWQGAWVGYGCGFVWYLGNCYWIYRTMNLYGGLSPVVSLVILILFALYLGLYHALFGAVVVRLGGVRGLWLAPFVWVAVELMRARVTGFPWDLLGNSQVDNLLLTRVAPVGGVMLMSFVIAAVNCLLAGWWVVAGGPGRRMVVAGLVVAVGLQVGGAVMAAHTGRPEPGQVAVLLQENLEVGAVGREVAPMSDEQMYAAFGSASLRPEVAVVDRSGGVTWAVSGAASKPALIAWPEAPAGFFTTSARFREAMGELARRANAPMVVGSLGVDRDASAARGYRLYDSASLIGADGSYAGRYDKIHLVPWGEYVPFKDLFFFASKLTAGVGNMDPGTQRTLFHTGGKKYGVFICYESIFGDEVREFVKEGAEVLVNISDDGWYGDTGAPWQHLNMARMRAIENHRWVVRDTNTGVTTTIDPLGRTWLEAPRHVRGAYAMPFGYERDVTLYTRYGDWFAWGCLGLVVGAVVFGGRRRVA